jgi:hypothetical protein
LSRSSKMLSTAMNTPERPTPALRGKWKYNFLLPYSFVTYFLVLHLSILSFDYIFLSSFLASVFPFFPGVSDGLSPWLTCNEPQLAQY